MNPLKIVVGLLLAAAVSPVSAATLYTVTAVGPAGSDAYGINNLGNVVGSTPNGGVTDPFMWTPGGGLHDLGTLGGTSVARAINDNNWVVGQSDDYAFRWTPAGGLSPLGNFFVITDTNYGDARGINNSNSIIGSGDLGNYSYTQIWANGGGANIPFVNDYSAGDAINDSGVYVGQLLNYPYPNTGYFETPTYSSGLGLLPDAINDSNVVVGTEGGLATLYSIPTFSSVTIGKLNGSDTSSEAFAINSINQVVGVSTGTGAFLWDSTHGIQTLSHLLVPSSSGWTILSGNGINNNGQIVGLGQFGGQQYAVLLTPTPEPSTLILAAMGIAGLFLAARRRSA